MTPVAGIDVETEAKDRRDLELPGHQLELLQDAVRAGGALRGLVAVQGAGQEKRTQHHAAGSHACPIPWS